MCCHCGESDGEDAVTFAPPGEPGDAGQTMRPTSWALVSSVLASAALLTGQGPLSEPRVGLAFLPPKGWTELPGDCDRGATVRLFAGPSALASKKEGTHTPLLRVMFFAKGGDGSLDVVDGLPRTTPFRSLEDFAVRGLGAKNVEQTSQKVGRIDCQRLTGSDFAVDHVLVGLAVPLPEGEAALCIEVLANHADKLKKEVDALFASVEAVAFVAAARPQPPWRVAAEWGPKDAAARLAAHRAFAEQIVGLATKAPELGYKVSKHKHWTVLSVADPAYTKKAVAAVETAREWLARKLPELAKGEPLPAVIRIFDHIGQFNAYVSTRLSTREYDQGRRELLLVNDRDNGGSTGWGQTLRAVLWHLLDDVDPGVLPALPRWFDNGWWEFLRSTKLDGKKLEFFAGDVEKGRIDYYRQKGQTMPALWDLMQEHIQPSPADGANEDVWGYTPECSRLIRWFLLHDGQPAFQKPTLVADYVKALGVAYWRLGPDPTADVALVGLSETAAKERNRRYYKWRDAMLVGANDVAVPLQPETWRAINETWFEFNKNFK